MTTETDANELWAEQYENRNPVMREIIDACAEREDMANYGEKAEVAREVGVDDHRVQYVVDEWSDLIEWRRSANRSPVDGEVVKEAYEDETLQAMAESAEPIADGMGDVRVSVDFTLDEAFRAMKLLPGDLGMRVFTQTIEDAGDVPETGLSALFEDAD